MIAVLAARRFLVDYARRPLNVVLLVAVPLIFVVATASALQAFAHALGNPAATGGIEAASAGWAAALIAGVGGFFHVSAARGADRRLAAGGAGPWPVVAARLGSGIVLAALAAGGSLVALAAKGGPAGSPEVAAATLAAALGYLGFGALIGTVVADEASGSLLVVLVWMIDVFAGPTMGTHGTLTWFLPQHFSTLLAVAGTTHTATTSDLLGAVVWTGGLLLAAAAGLASVTGAHRKVRRSSHRRLGAALRASFTEYARVPLLWVLVVVAPATLIGISLAITPTRATPLLVGTGLELVTMLRLHGAVMVPITVAFVAGVIGLLVVLGSAQADRRLVLVGFRPIEVLVGRLAVVVVGTLLATGVALGTTALGFTPRSWPPFAMATLLAGLTYAAIGVLLGPLVGKVGGLYLVLALPFIDFGVGQDPMLNLHLPAWGSALPGHPTMQLLLRGAFVGGTDWSQFGAALAWLAVLGGAAVAVFSLIAAGGAHRSRRTPIRVTAMAVPRTTASVETPEATDRFVPAMPRPGPEPCGVPEGPDPHSTRSEATP